MHTASDYPPKRTGFCSQCAEQLWDAKTLRSERPGVVATFMLADGSVMDLTLCDACDEVPDLDRLWRQAVVGWLQGKSVSLTSTEYAARQMRENFILLRLYARRWKDMEEAVKWHGK